LTLAREEVADFVSGSRALLVNLGTLDGERRQAIPVAIAAARQAGRPWILDPVFANRSPGRLEMAAALCGQGPAAIRANGAEVAALAQALRLGEGGARELALAARACVAMTGKRDQVCAGERKAEISNGHELMDKVTAMGCALGAVLAAFCAVESDPFAAAVQALTVFAVAGDVAGEQAKGPGSFVPAFLDALYAIDQETLKKRALIA
ncbi:MAG TPA: hydroxyethylthiazole kinase, partial [Hyphomicrobiales bacterium]|nr:hydroxyethylthiazole kinase [Hyphomicrobiales bacterium]